MFDIGITEINSLAYFYCFFMFLITYTIGIRQIKFEPYGIQSNGGKLLFYLLLYVILMTAFANTDYFSYQQLTKMAVGHSVPHLEDVYGYIIEFCNNNYFMFRTIVWGGAVVLISMTTKLAKVSTPHILFFLFLFFFPTFDYARASLAMAIYYLGIVLLLNTGSRGHGLLSKVLGMILVFTSYFFHKSMVAMIVLVPLLLLPLNKKTLLLLLFSTPIILYFVKGVLFSFIGLDFSNDELGELNQTFSQYTEREDLGFANWKGILSSIFAYALFYVPFYYIVKSFLKSKSPSSFNNQIFKILIGVMLLCHSMFMLGPQSYSLYYRYLYMSMIPMSILLVSLFENGNLSLRSINKLISIGFICRLMLLLAGSMSHL